MPVISKIERFITLFFQTRLYWDPSERFDHSLAMLSLEFMKTDSPERYLMNALTRDTSG
jgi:hypothetical protein